MLQGRSATDLHPPSAANISVANESSGSQAGSKRRQARGDVRPRPARVAAGERHAGAISGHIQRLLEPVWHANGLASSRSRTGTAGPDDLIWTQPWCRGALAGDQHRRDRASGPAPVAPCPALAQRSWQPRTVLAPKEPTASLDCEYAALIWLIPDNCTDRRGRAWPDVGTPGYPAPTDALFIPTPAPIRTATIRRSGADGGAPLGLHHAYQYGSANADSGGEKADQCGCCRRRGGTAPAAQRSAAGNPRRGAARLVHRRETEMAGEGPYPDGRWSRARSS